MKKTKYLYFDGKSSLKEKYYQSSKELNHKIVNPYNEAVKGNNQSFVIAPECTDELVSIMSECNSSKIRVGVHSTGHDFEGRSSSSDVIIHMRKFNSVKYDPSTNYVTVGGGAKVYEINKVLKKYSRAISTGTNQDVGITGLTLGGGAAYTSRMHGLTCDALVRAEVCTFEGTKLSVSDETHPEEMRVLRGGGGCSIGIVTSLTFKTYEIYAVTAFSAEWVEGECYEIISTLEKLLIEAPPELSMRIGYNVTGVNKKKTLTLTGQLQNSNASFLLDYFKDVLTTSTFSYQVLPYYEAMAGALHQTSGGCFKIKSRFALSPIGEVGLRDLIEFANTWIPTNNPDGAGFALFAWGGKINEDSKLEKSYMQGRSALYLASFDTSWEATESHQAIESQKSWLSELHAIANKYLSELSYINFPDSDDGSYASRHFNTYKDEISKVLDIYDPNKIMHQHSRCVEHVQYSQNSFGKKS